MPLEKADHVFNPNNHSYFGRCMRSKSGTHGHDWCLGWEIGCGFCNTPGCAEYREHPNSVMVKQSTASASNTTRTFASGATRSSLEGKLDYSGYLSPFAIQRYGRYMLKHQTQADGTIRSSSNWKKGIPLESFKESLIRHTIDLWAAYEAGDLELVEELACADLFNIQGLLHELLKKRKRLPF